MTVTVTHERSPGGAEVLRVRGSAHDVDRLVLRLTGRGWVFADAPQAVAPEEWLLPVGPSGSTSAA